MANRPPPRSTANIDPALAIEAEVRANVLAQKLGHGSVADLNLSADFLSRIADRAIRDSFHERSRAVADPASPANSGVPLAASSPPVSSDSSVPLATSPLPVPSDLPPTLASFRSPETIGDDLASQLLTDPLPPDASKHKDLEPRRIVRSRLAKDGLLPTLARVILHLGPARFDNATTEHIQTLERFGLPLDLLSWFHLEGVEHSTPAIISYIAKELASGTRIEKLEKHLRRAKFTPTPTIPNFRPTSESGLDKPTLLRAQLTRDTHFAAPTDGGCLDLIESTLKSLPNCDAILHVQDIHHAGITSLAITNAGTRTIAVIPQPLKVSQWAGDNAKAGTISDSNAINSLAMLTPRFAARREDASLFIPGDDLAVSASNIPSIHARRSPLLFEGGNILVIDDTKRGDRVLLVGEAELFRNQSLGLTRDQAFEALRIEFHCQRAVILPAASYHIDQELTVRTLPDGSILAFLPDAPAAARLVIATALTALRNTNRWPADLVDQALAFLHANQLRECLTLVWTGLSRERSPEGTWPTAFADILSTDPADSGIGNLHRFLFAADTLAAEASDPSEFQDPHFRAVIRSLIRREQDRRSLRARLEGLGWKTILIPALPEDSRGINPLNGLQLSTAYLIPTYGGLFSELDAAATAAFRAAFDPSVRIHPVPSAESQRRQGALHCSIAVFGCQ